MKNISINPWIFTLALMYAAVIPTAVVNAQGIEGRASIMAGDYLIKGFGEVSTPEQGNHFHQLFAETFVTKASVRRENKFFFGGYAQMWSRFNTEVTSLAVAGKFQHKELGSFQFDVAAGPVLQYRDRLSYGGMVNAKATFLMCQGDLAFSMFAHAEAGGRGLFYDSYVGVQYKKFELRRGMSSFVGGNYFRLDFHSSERYSFGATYAWDPLMNKLVADAGYEGFHRRALGVNATVHF